MIKELNQTFKKVNDFMGVDIKLPPPKKNMLKSTSALNLVVGAGLLATSILFSNKWCGILGGLSVISGIIQKHESKDYE